MMYRTVIRPLLFGVDPEVSHDLALTLLGAVGPVWPRLPGPGRDPLLETTVCGIRFPSPIGLAGGFDKTGRGVGARPALRVGVVGGGTATPPAQPGNPPPRPFPRPQEQAPGT